MPPLPIRLRPRRPARGFTLVELLVAVALGVIILLVIAQIFSGASTVFTVSDQSSDAYSTARVVLDIMQEQLEAVCPVWHQTGGATDNSLIGIVGTDAGDLDTIQIRFYGADQKISVVEYVVNASNLTWAYENTTSPPAWAPSSHKLIIARVSKFNIQYWDQNASPAAWVDDWSASTTSFANYLPAAVKVELTIEGVLQSSSEEPKDLSLERVVNIPIARKY